LVIWFLAGSQQYPDVPHPLALLRARRAAKQPP
jgi:hypothetical protein